MRIRRQLLSSSSIVLLLVGVIYAPLFHVHTDGAEIPLVHAHFPELATAEDESVVHMESSHSHGGGRSIDVLTTVASSFVHFDAAIQSATLTIPEPEPSRGFVPAASPRAHAPPALDFLTPRAPPA